ncbi:MAG: TIGR00341 family protein [Armatimonadota bacterium]
MNAFRILPDTDIEPKEELRKNIIDLSSPKKSYFLMMCLSAVIASYGLLSNSAAVVIGAMLVAPLMGPIFGIALGLLTGNNKLTRDALFAEILGILLALGISVIIGLVPMRPAFGTEILARTHPNIYDVIIALAAGLAGTYALLYKRISAALAGIAVATALLPPLAACGLCLAVGRWSQAAGAFFFFLANLISIELMAALVFLFMGMLPKREQQNGTAAVFTRKFAPSIIILFILAGFMTYTFVNMINENRFSEKLNTILKEEINSIAGTRILDTEYTKTKNSIDVTIDVLTQHPLEPLRISQIQQELREKLNPKIYLIVESLSSKASDSKGPVFLDESEIKNMEYQKKTDSLSKLLVDQLKNYPGTQLADVLIDKDTHTIMATVRTPHKITPDEVEKIQDNINSADGRQVKLIITSSITSVADAQQYLYQPEEVGKKLTPEELKFHDEIEKQLRVNLHKTVKGAELTEFRYKKKNDYLLVFAVARTPKIIEAPQVKNMQASLTKSLKTKIHLVVRSVVGGDVTSTGFLNDFDENQFR